MTIRRVALADAEMPAPGEIAIVPIPAGRPPKISLILVGTDSGPKAYWNVCRHVPVPLDGGLGSLPGHRLECLTHGARYAPETGLCVSGPCQGKSLEAVSIERDGDGWTALVPDSG